MNGVLVEPAAAPPESGLCELRLATYRLFRCSAHDSDAWAAAAVLGATIPCQLPDARWWQDQAADARPADLFTSLVLLQRADGTVLCRLARNPTVADVIVQHLARHPQKWVRQAVARYTKDPAVLKQLLTDEYDGARQAVASNRMTPGWMLDQLALDPNWAVRDSVRYERWLRQQRSGSMVQ